MNKKKRWLKRVNFASNMYEFTGNFLLLLASREPNGSPTNWMRKAHTWVWEMELFYAERLLERYGI